MNNQRYEDLLTSLASQDIPDVLEVVRTQGVSILNEPKQTYLTTFGNVRGHLLFSRVQRALKLYQQSQSTKSTNIEPIIKYVSDLDPMLGSLRPTQLIELNQKLSHTLHLIQHTLNTHGIKTRCQGCGALKSNNSYYCCRSRAIDQAPTKPQVAIVQPETVQNQQNQHHSHFPAKTKAPDPTPVPVASPEKPPEFEQVRAAEVNVDKKSHVSDPIPSADSTRVAVVEEREREQEKEREREQEKEKERKSQQGQPSGTVLRVTTNDLELNNATQLKQVYHDPDSPDNPHNPYHSL